MIKQGIHPSVSIFLPVSNHFNDIKTTEGRLKSLVKSASEKLHEKYGRANSDKVLAQLEKMMSELKLGQHVPALGLFANESSFRVMPIRHAVAEKVVVDESYQIREILRDVKESIDYWLVLLNQRHVRIFRGYNDKLVEQHVKDMAESVVEYFSDHKEKVSNFTDPSGVRDVDIDKLLHSFENNFWNHWRKDPLPVFIGGSEKVMAQFMNITHHKKEIASLFHGNYEHSSPAELSEIVKPLREKELARRQAEALEKIKQSERANSLVSGIENVWEAVKDKRGRMLFVEKDYSQQADILDDGRINVHKNDSDSAREDIVDDLIEKVLDQGGDVFFMENGSLVPYRKVALVPFW